MMNSDNYETSTKTTMIDIFDQKLDISGVQFRWESAQDREKFAELFPSLAVCPAREDHLKVVSLGPP